MPSLNRVEIIGNVGSEPELRFTSNGKSVTSFSVACNSRYTRNGESQENTEWFNVIAWNKLAENCNQFVVKGMMVYVVGRIELHKWEGQDGKERSQLNLIANNVLFLSKKEEQGGKQGENLAEESPY